MDWQRIETLPDEGEIVALYFGDRQWSDSEGNNVSFGSVRDAVERIELCFWHEIVGWCYAGTGHPVSEFETDEHPTHWLPLTTPPRL